MIQAISWEFPSPKTIPPRKKQKKTPVTSVPIANLAVLPPFVLKSWSHPLTSVVDLMAVRPSRSLAYIPEASSICKNHECFAKVLAKRLPNVVVRIQVHQKGSVLRLNACQWLRFLAHAMWNWPSVAPCVSNADAHTHRHPLKKLQAYEGG